MARYWVAGSGNWSDATNHWSDSSGGTPNASFLPTASDDVVFDTLSNATAYTVTVNATANCADFTMDAPLTGNVTWAGSSALNIYGSINLSGGASITRTYTGAIVFVATTTGKTLTWNGVTMASSIQFDGVGGGWTQQDAYLSTGALTLSKGAFNTNGQSCNIGTQTFNISASTTRSLTLGSSTVTCGSWSATTTTNLTFTPNTSAIITSGNTLSLGGLTYNDFTIGVGTGSVTGANTFATLTITGTAVKTDAINFNADQICTTAFVCNGNSSINRMLIRSNSVVTARTITAAATTVTNADFRDITGAGAASWDLSGATGGSGNCGGNTMQALGDAAFTTPVTTDCSAGTTWSTATWSSRVPLPQDTATFSGSGRTITQDMPRIGSVNFTGSSGLTWTTNTTASCFGSINLTDLGTLTASTSTYTFEGRGSNTLTCAGKTWEKSVTLDAPGGTLTIQDAFIAGVTRPLAVTRGTLDMNDQSITMGLFSSSNSNTRVINLGTGTITLTGTTGTIWDLATTTNLTLNAETSTIKFTGALTAAPNFSGGGKTYNNFWNATTNAFAVNIVGSNTFNDLKINAGRTQLFTAGTTTTVTTFDAIGGLGTEITIGSVTASGHTLSAAAGTISVEYCNISRSTAQGGATWEAFTSDGNVDGGNNSGWDFSGSAISSVGGVPYANVSSVSSVPVANIASINSVV